MSKKINSSHFHGFVFKIFPQVTLLIGSPFLSEDMCCLLTLSHRSLDYNLFSWNYTNKSIIVQLKLLSWEKSIQESNHYINILLHKYTPIYYLYILQRRIIHQNITISFIIKILGHLEKQTKLTTFFAWKAENFDSVVARLRVGSSYHSINYYWSIQSIN